MLVVVMIMLVSSSKHSDNGNTTASVNRFPSDKRSSYSNGDRNSDSSNDRQHTRVVVGVAQGIAIEVF